MATQHSAISDANRHEAKGASTASAGQVIKSNGDGTTSFVAPNTLSNISIGSTLEVQSIVTQGPAAVDTPYQVTWGAGDSNANVTVASNGIITINTAGLYAITFNLNYGRANATGIAKLVSRLLINGTASGFPASAQMDTSINFYSYSETIIRSFAATDTIVMQIIRDSTGANDGGLYTLDPVLAGWNNVPSAAARIQKIAGAA